MSDNNIWSNEWDAAEEDWSGGGMVSKRLPRGEVHPRLGATVYELDPGDFGVYHFHHADEELLVVLRGRPTLRTPAGERRLVEGDAVHFVPGPAGAHALKNETGEAVRVLMTSTITSPEVVEYPDLRQITAQARTASMTGDRLWLIHDVEEPKQEVDT
jgi:uncharacterized cupin superfamily protein